MRTLVDIPDDRLADLDAYSRRAGKSRAEVIREAIRKFLEDKVSTSDEVFGIWADRDLDALAYESALRAEWEPGAAVDAIGNEAENKVGDASPLRHEHPDRPPQRRRRRSG